MKGLERVLYIIAALSVLFLLTDIVYAGTALENPVCPIMGGRASHNITVEHEGVLYSLCCKGCDTALKNDPDMYLSKFTYEKDGVTYITKEYLKNRIENYRNIYIIDVLSEGSFARNHIKGAVNIPLSRLSDSAKQVIKDKEAEVIVYCSNYMCHASTKGVKILKKMGFENVVDYKGGINEWMQYYPEHTGGDA